MLFNSFHNTFKVFALIFYHYLYNVLFCITTTSQMEQFLCVRGYSDKMAGMVSSTVLFSGCLGTVPIGILAAKTQKSLALSKICLFTAILIFGTIAYAITLPGQPALLIALNAIFGFILIG